jgi:hypothetical protein
VLTLTVCDFSSTLIVVFDPALAGNGLPIVLLEAGLVAAGRATLVFAFLTGAAFLAGAFLAGAFFATAFLAGAAFFAGAFFATAFFAEAAFLAGAFFTAGLALFLVGTRGTLCPIGAKCHSRHRDAFKDREILVTSLCLE